ncbi:MAG: OmpA family protein [Rhodobacteraceae bacterium]|nr:OmpA family protein [Paracoccaceae bacterium]
MVTYYDGWVEQLREGSHSITPAGDMQGKWSGYYFECTGGASPAGDTAGRFTVYFGFDRSDLNSQARAVIDEVVDAVRAQASPLLSVVGHTDTSGSVGYNQTLSERRANTVKGALVDEGVDGGSITTSGRSENEPAVATGDGVIEPLNRRVEITISE